jgi:Pentapeptide repeats (8 copies)
MRCPWLFMRRPCYLPEANLSRANLPEANLSRAVLSRAVLSGANLSGAVLSGAYLVYANLVEADFTDADLTGCRIYGISAWGLKLSENTKQRNLIITKDEPEITVDDIEVAQFIYLLLHNEKIRRVIDTITSKAVLILGRFTPERKAVLDALREELRKRNYLPILFDFDKPASKDLTGTVQTLANMARFIIADLTEPSCIPHELAMLVPSTVVPVQPILLSGQTEYAMFVDLKRRYHWVLEPYPYETHENGGLCGYCQYMADKVMGE